ncbi:MAG: winged helix-turn-helix transcriptional regulator [Ilumatobacteraceae bacterium]
MPTTRPPERPSAVPATDEHTPLERTLALVGDRWSILIVRAALRGIRRFDDFADDLGIARPILTNRLRRLVDGGVMAREPYQERPTRYEYRLTPAGVALSPALVALVRWGETHLADGEHDIVLVHAPCGTEFEQGFWCRTCATTFGPSAIRGESAGGERARTEP